MPKTSAVLIAYNEAEFLAHTLPPLVAACDEIVVVDMGSTDGSNALFQRVLREHDLVVRYERRNLFQFGFSHPRNYGAGFASGEWLLVVDADEFVAPADLREAVRSLGAETANALDVERRNYEPVEGLTLDGLLEDFAAAPFTSERHRRLYRHKPGMRFEGLVHEELWEGDRSAFLTASPSDLTLHHLSAYRTLPSETSKQELYAYLLLKACLYPAFRHGTNAWFYDTYVPENLQVLVWQANNFAAAQRLSPFEKEAVEARLELDRAQRPPAEPGTVED